MLKSNGACSIFAFAAAAALTPAAAQNVEVVQEGGRTAKPDIIEVFGQGFATVPTAATSAAKSSLPLIDTPATVTVINRELIDQQLATDLQEVLRNTSGLNQAGNSFGVGDFLQSRGLPVSYAYDGLYGGAGLGPDTYAPTRSLTNVQRVEVLQGANATIYGPGSAGGLVNLIEKKPQFEAAYAVEARIGSYDTYGGVVDATGPLNNLLAYRFVAGVLRKDGFRNLSIDRNELYGSLAAQFSNTNRLTFSVAWIDDKVQVDSIGYPVRIFNAASTTPPGIPAGEVGPENLPNDPASSQQLTPAQIQQLADSLAPGDGLEPFDLDGASLISPLSRPNDGEELRLKLRWEWAPIEGLSIIPSTQYRYYSSEYVRQTGAFNYVYWNRRGVVNQPPRAPLVVDGELFPFAARRQEYRKFDVQETSWDNFIDIQYKKDFLGVSNEALLTGYYQKVDIDIFRASLYDADNSRSADNPVPYIFDIRDPNFPEGDFEDFDFFITGNYNKEVTARGIGFQNITYWRPWFITRAGVGWNEIEQEFDSGPTELGPDGDPVDDSGTGLVFNVGGTLKPIPWASAFVAYGEGRTSFSFEGTLNGVSDRPDSESTNFEAGVKLQDPDGRFSGGVTYFETARTNLRYNNPEFEDNPADPNFNIDVPEFFFDGQDRTQGWQIDANASIFEGLFVNANITLQDARNRQNPNSTAFNAPQKGVPDVFASAFIVYEPPVEIAGGRSRLSLGYQFQDERTIESTAFGLPDAVLPEQGLWDLGLEYVQERWSAKLQVENLTDELAYERALFLGGQPTAPRTFEFVVRSNF
ncbi:MAG: TonB-dependent receptor plug domain-containing protein [Pseudomonadota bacterium]